jgi:hypothetical protein
MTTQLSTKLSTKLSALGLALLVNAMMFGGVAYLFAVPVQAAGFAALAQSAPTADMQMTSAPGGVRAFC